MATPVDEDPYGVGTAWLMLGAFTSVVLTGLSLYLVKGAAFAETLVGLVAIPLGAALFLSSSFAGVLFAMLLLIRRDKVEGFCFLSLLVILWHLACLI
ncbi:MAG: hypothetical protein SF028_01295 [Candidatus Sumerlaeia bacterium]|nr:hypothetical protein [Candidatus Sumerlaeia bacterium]